MRLTLGACGVVLLAGLSLAIVSANPVIAAQGAEVLRRVIGEENTATLETWVLGWQDRVQSLVYRADGDQSQAPWASPTPAPTATLVAPTATVDLSTRPSGIRPTPPPTRTLAPDPPRPTPTAPPEHLPAALKPMGQLAGEGQWSVYLNNPAGEPVAYRTFLQPDAQRGYAVAAIVAIDLTAVRLHFMLGSQEPASNVPIDRPGRIPSADVKSGLLLAAFNGGFKAEHGQFGAMQNGVVVLAPRDGFGTVAIYDDGRVSIGSWGNDVFWADGLRNWRQNGPLIVQGGQINPHTADNTPEDWGYTVSGDTATWRSGLAISQDGQTLYYMAGSYLTLPVLAQVMQDTGATNGIQLDINGYWVLFETFRPADGGLQPDPLLDGMKNDGRYLHPFDRDFFYLTANAN